RERAAESEAVGDRAAENREEPNHAAKDSCERASLLGGEIQLFVEIVGESGECAVVGEALEDFRDVGDPEGTVEAGAYFVEPLGKTHVSDGRRAASEPPRMRGGMIAERGTPTRVFFGKECGND